jgi:hypothetical protein
MSDTPRIVARTGARRNAPESWIWNRLGQSIVRESDPQPEQRTVPAKNRRRAETNDERSTGARTFLR